MMHERRYFVVITDEKGNEEVQYFYSPKERERACKENKNMRPVRLSDLRKKK